MIRVTRLFVGFLLMLLLVLLPGLAISQETKIAGKKASERTLGVERVRGVEESGFHNTEWSESDDPFRWTNGSARLVVPFEGPVPRAMQVRLGLDLPKPAKLRVRVNGTLLLEETLKPQPEWSRTFDLSGLVAMSPITIEILSDTFNPSSGKNPGTDDRDLGVRVRGITFLDKVPDYSGINLAVEPVMGADVTGLHNREQGGSGPFRWTDGHVRVVVPSNRDRRWKTIAVVAEIPNRPDYRIKLTVNGRVLIDEGVKRESVWSKEFPLEGIELDRQAVIELTSSTIPLGETRMKDGRTLGIRLRELILKDK